MGGESRRAGNLLASFGYAFAGLWHLLRSQRNARIHAAITLGVVVAGLITGLTPVEWAIIALTTGVVFSAEAFNTALEALVDHVEPEFHPLAKIAKDAAAAAVLIGALAAVAVGALIFLSHWLA